ncbi:MAG: proline--tRNA ligase [Leptospiraceae bacterium]|nr:proline--tRNA ligase [Leptospiraceae bacterium]MCK6380104.1 proline--tRNA ligase [Leptospiraceae bacterium]NUM40523.1 proline--tRNA ligase [Leptospiraceae bacterium]
MRASKYFIPTTKEDPSDAVVVSHKLMIRAGLVRKASSGLYNYLPMGLRVIKKIEKIVREEMDNSGALEFELPILTPEEIWSISGRWERMGKEMFRLKDRHEVEYCLGPTHEEGFTNLLKPILKSYKDLPINVYQIHTKFRDEIRPRFGVIRSREFTMKDAYSFHLDIESLNETYEVMRKTYRKIFQRCGLKTISVQADSGTMGGSGSEEFMVVSPIGEETLTLCNSCGYSGNVEKTPVKFSDKSEIQKNPIAVEKVSTPDIKTIQEVASYLSCETKDTVKAILLVGNDGRKIVVFIRGDRELNEVKLLNHLSLLAVRQMSLNECKELSIEAGFTGPGLEEKDGLIVLYDNSIDENKSYIVGGNEKGYHKKNFIFSREFSNPISFLDLSKSEAGDECPSCGKPLITEKGIEVGHIFKLGDKYTKAFDLKVSDKNGKPKTPTMGCYGIGVNRTMATILEQSNDSGGIIWPISVAPYEISIVSIAKEKSDIDKVHSIYTSLVDSGLEVFWDDRDLSPGYKFKDSELIGFPIRLTLGKDFFSSGEFSILNRKSMEENKYKFTSNEDIITILKGLRDSLSKELEGEIHGK